jgi:hypothetical protein
MRFTLNVDVSDIQRPFNFNEGGLYLVKYSDGLPVYVGGVLQYKLFARFTTGTKIIEQDDYFSVQWDILI